MVVQHILCSRMGKREVKPIVPKVEPPPEKNADKEESTEKESTETSDNPVKEEDAENTEKEAKTEGTTEDEEKSETVSVKKEEVKKLEEPPPESKPAEPPVVVETKPQFVEVEEYFIKYRNFSYLHCEWKTEEEMYKGDKRIQAKLKRFKQKQQQNTNIFENVLNIYYFLTNILITIVYIKILKIIKNDLKPFPFTKTFFFLFLAGRRSLQSRFCRS
jgi:chromodomain-helicase-DNA-binding protein 7